MIVLGHLATRATKAACPAPVLFFVGSLHGNKGSRVPLLPGGSQGDASACDPPYVAMSNRGRESDLQKPNTGVP